jgi:prevent-host-death family protein
MKIQRIGAGEFKAHCLRLIDEVKKQHIELIITKRGRPLVKLVPLREEPAFSLFGCMKDTAVIKGDIIAPTDEEWEADA